VRRCVTAEGDPLRGGLDAVVPGPGAGLPGPYAVGEYAAALRSKLRAFARVQLVGELVNLRPSRARVYFELRDSAGAIPCAAWRDDWERIAARPWRRSGGLPRGRDSAEQHCGERGDDYRGSPHPSRSLAAPTMVSASIPNAR